MIKVLSAGLHTSIQDLGRVGYRNYGVPSAGAMDMSSANYGNEILANDPNAAVMEITLQGPTLQFMTGSKIALTGADLSPMLNEESVKMHHSINIEKNDILSFGKRNTGVRSYMSITDGFQTETVLKSRSFYQGITKQSILAKGDEVAFHSSFGASSIGSPRSKPRVDFSKQNLEVYGGPEFDLLNAQQKEQLLSQHFTIGINNRMAYQLKEPLKNNLKSILSSAVLPGTVQLTPSGNLIVLMRDCQTTGGYPRILQLTEDSINILAQKVQYDVVSFNIM